MKPLMPLLRILILLAAAIGGIVMAQDHLLYYPDKAPVAEVSRFVGGAQPWPSSEDFRGLLSAPPSAAVRGTILVFHGNAGHLGDRIERFTAAEWARIELHFQRMPLARLCAIAGKKTP